MAILQQSIKQKFTGPFLSQYVHLGLTLSYHSQMVEKFEECHGLNPAEKTDWKLVYIVALITFLSVIQNFVVGISEWPYMEQIDPEATSEFFGYIGSLSSLGHAICSPLVGYWSSSTGNAKCPLIAGRIVALFGCLLYLSVEMFQHNRRYVMLICYTIFGTAMSTLSVLRGYIAKISSTRDRAKAVSLFGLSVMLAVTVGPVFQLLFAPLSYPGIDIIKDKIHINIYTGPIYVAFASNIIGTIVIVLFFKQEKQQKISVSSGINNRKASRAKEAIFYDLKKFDISLAFACILIRMSGVLSLVTINTITTPIMMSVFGWSNTFTVKAGSLTQAVVGIMSIIVFVGFGTGKLLQYISERGAALISLVLFGSFYILTYQWPILSRTILIKNETSDTRGCDVEYYAWCSDTLTVNPTFYIFCIITVLGLAIPLLIISTDSIYSKILGQIDQGTMQGVFLFFLDIINIAGPLIIAPAFVSGGPKLIWIVNETAAVLALGLWILIFKRLASRESSSAVHV